MKKLYSYSEYFGRMGDLEGVFVADDLDINKIMGKEIYFGEVLGKHSEIIGTINQNTLTVMTDDQDFIAKFEKLKLASGYNPLDYFEPEEEGDECEEQDECE